MYILETALEKAKRFQELYSFNQAIEVVNNPYKLLFSIDKDHKINVLSEFDVIKNATLPDNAHFQDKYFLKSEHPLFILKWDTLLDTHTDRYEIKGFVEDSIDKIMTARSMDENEHWILLGIYGNFLGIIDRYRLNEITYKQPGTSFQEFTK